MPDRGWNGVWAQGRAAPDYWQQPEPRVVAWAEALRDVSASRVLDLGCGIGRHSVALARMGFEVVAGDVSLPGLVTCNTWLREEGLEATCACHLVDALPYPNASFDALVTFHVIYHTTAAGLRHNMNEIRRVLRPDGHLYATLISRADSRIGRYRADVGRGLCREIEPFTFVYIRDAPDDKHIPHHYCDEAELKTLLSGFAVDQIEAVYKPYTDQEGICQTGAHYHVRARRAA